jgi:SAM-dependent methyltransferase
MPWRWDVAERDHEIQNPTSAEKIRLLGDYLRLTPESRVLDLACGKAGPALILAGAYGCRISGIERMSEFADAGRERVAAAGLQKLIEITTADAREAPLEAEAWDAVLCLGASFIWGTLAETAAVLHPAVRPNGFIAVGEPFWRRWPLPEVIESEGWTTLPETAVRMRDAGFAVTGMIAASDDDWDRYESLHWRALEEWLSQNPDDPDAADMREQHERSRSLYLGRERELLGWAIFVGRKAGADGSVAG